MHYANGRLAKNGDKIVLFSAYAAPVVGILYDAAPGNDYCNGKLAATKPNDPCPSLKECLHLDDVLALIPHGLGVSGIGSVPNASAPPSETTAGS